MKKVIAFMLVLACFLNLAACGGKTIGEISGAENEYIIIDDVKYVLDTGNNFSQADKGTYLGKVSNSKITMKVYSVKGDTNGDYIYILWDWEGTFYKKEEYTADMREISQAVAARFETSDGKSVIVDSEIDVLRSMSELEMQAAPMTPADNPEDWIYRITFNPSDKVLNGEEIIVLVYEKYVQIENEYYLPKDNVSFESIMEWFDGKAAYFFS